MLVRLPVAAFHLVLSLAGLLGFGLFLAQVALNTAWERGLYGVTSDQTLTIGAEAGLGFLFAVAQGAAAIAFVRGGRIPGHAIVLVSLVLAWTTAWPINALLGLAGIAGVLEVWSHTAPAEPAPDEDEDDDPNA